jgi:hypothetical protein
MSFVITGGQLPTGKPAEQCPLSDNSGQKWILGRDGLSANDPSGTF